MKVFLNSGYEMPILGLGTYNLLDEVCVNSFSKTLKAVAELIDTAYIYNKEENIG